MESLPSLAEPLPPGTEPASDGWFGDAELDGDDAESLWCRLMPDEIRFIDRPLLDHLQRRPYHLLRLVGSFQLAQLLQDHGDRLFRSECNQDARGKTRVGRLLFNWGEGALVVHDGLQLLVYAPTRQAALAVAGQLQPYRKAQKDQPGFKLISVSGSQPTAQWVRVEPAAPWTDQDLALHYGEDLLGWERVWLERLRQRPSGLSILHGPPGCGKTSYLRSLLARLLGSFEFYYLPVSAFEALDSPRFVAFWLEQKVEAARRRVAVVEDAESLLLPRDEGSRSTVSSLLNATDGFLGEHLRLQILCTTNAPVRQLDAALLRPGRLLGMREFRRLTGAEARRLADARGLSLVEQPDYSLGEIYCGAPGNPSLAAGRSVGFARS